MAGNLVGRSDLDWRISRAVIALRDDFESVGIIKGFLDQYPSNAVGGDVLTKTVKDNGFGYTVDEAYLIRLVFDQFSALALAPVLEQARKLTGLE